MGQKKVTKKEIALKLFKTVNNRPRKEIVEIFARELDTTIGSARTHLSWCIKESTDINTIRYKTRTINKKSLKREKAYQLFVANNALSRNNMIEIFVDELDMSWNSAATHCSMCTIKYKKEYPQVKHNSIL